MRILVYGINYAPELTGVGKYTGDMCAWLSSRGHEVTVVTAPPYYPSWRVSSPYASWRYATESLSGVRVVRCPLWVPDRPNAVRRILHLLSFAATSFPAVAYGALRERPDVVFFVVPSFFGTVAALFASRLGGSRCWLHIQDFEAEAAFSLGLMKCSWIKGLISAVERTALRRFDRVSTVSGNMLELTLAKGVAPGKAVLFPNWVDTAMIRPSAGTSPLRGEFGIPPGSHVALYSGNLGEKQGLEVLIAAARVLRDRRDLLFVICGEGASRQRLEREAQGLENVRFFPLQPAGRLNDLLNVADIHLLPQKRDMDCFVMPSKLLGMMASGRPIIASTRGGSDLSNIVSECGRVVPPGDEGAFADAIIRLVDDPATRKRLGDRARQLSVENWDVSSVLGRLESWLSRLTGEES